MAGIFDGLFGFDQGGGLLGGYGQPMNILSQPQQQGMAGGLLGQMPGLPGMSPMMAQQPQQGGILGGLQSMLGQIGDPEGKRAQRALQNYIALQQLELQRKTLEEKPSVQKLSVDGQDRLVRVTPGGQASYLNPTGGAAPNPNAPPVPAGMDASVWRKELTEAEVKNQQEAVKSAKAAADMQPLLDEAAEAYKEVQRLDAAGPFIASAPGRWLAKGMSSLGDVTGAGSISKPLELARQRYDKALASIQARLTGAQNQGQGQVSNFERQLYSAQYPQLTEQNFEAGQNIWDQLRAATRQTIEAGRTSPLSRSPSVSGVLERPAITPGNAPQAAPPLPTMPQNARQAPDGKWYMPDPNRPGKFLRINP